MKTVKAIAAIYLCNFLTNVGAELEWQGPVASTFELPLDESHEISRQAFDQFPGETWDGIGGGDTDLGNPVSAIGAGVVIFAEEAKSTWGNMVIIRHAYRNGGGELTFIDSVYAYLLEIFVRVGDEVQLGEKIGAIGKSKDDKDNAKLYFAIRKKVGGQLNENDPDDLRRHYHVPSKFIAGFSSSD
ncbi:MAG: peptidoglycan DD-metalloendopeptidase family protein [Verrucomicrobiota bacterium]